MPRAAKKQSEIDPDALYTAWQAGSADIDGITYSVTAGERRRGSDPLVVHHSWLFVEDGVPAAERPNAFHAIVARHDAEQPPPEFEVTLSGPLPQPLEREEVIQLTRSVVVRAGLVDDSKVHRFEKDDVFPAACELVSLLPDDAYEAGNTQFTKAKGRR
jgi:hypothetical protein